MSVLVVTGGYGMLGSNLVKESLGRYSKVIVIDSDVRGMKKYAHMLWGEADLHIFERDIRNLTLSEIENIRSLIGNENLYFVHLADIVAGIGYVFSNQFSVLDENTSIDMASFKLAKKLGASKVIYASTACVFNQNSQRSIESKVSMSRDLYPAYPESTYGWAKLYGELALFNLFDEDDDVAVIYFHNLIGFPCDFASNKSQMLPGLINRLIRLKADDDKQLLVWGSGNQGRALVPVSVAVSAITTLLSQTKMVRRNHVGPRFCTSVKAIASHLLTLMPDGYSLKFDETKPEGDIGRSVADDEDLIVDEIYLDDILHTINATFTWIDGQIKNEG